MVGLKKESKAGGNGRWRWRREEEKKSGGGEIGFVHLLCLVRSIQSDPKKEEDGAANSSSSLPYYIPTIPQLFSSQSPPSLSFFGGEISFHPSNPFCNLPSPFLSPPLQKNLICSLGKKE